MSIKDLEFNSDIDKVVGIQFSLFFPEEIERKSVAEITTHEIMMVIFWARRFI